MKVKKVIALCLSLGALLNHCEPSFAFGRRSKSPVPIIKVESGNKRIYKPEPYETYLKKGSFPTLASLVVVGGVASKLGQKKTIEVPRIPSAGRNQNTDFNNLKINIDTPKIDMPFINSTERSVVTWGDLLRSWKTRIGSNAEDTKFLATFMSEEAVLKHLNESNVPSLPWMDGIHFYALDGSTVEYDDKGNLLLNENTKFYDIMPEFLKFFINYLNLLTDDAIKAGSLKQNSKVVDLIGLILDKLEKGENITLETLTNIFGNDFVKQNFGLLVKFLQLFLGSKIGFGEKGGLALWADKKVGKMLELGQQIPIVSCARQGKMEPLSGVTPASLTKDSKNLPDAFVLCNKTSDSGKEENFEINLLGTDIDSINYNKKKQAYQSLVNDMFEGNSFILGKIKEWLDGLIGRGIKEKTNDLALFFQQIKVMIGLGRDLSEWASVKSEIFEELSKNSLINVGDNLKSNIKDIKMVINQTNNLVGKAQ